MASRQALREEIQRILRMRAPDAPAPIGPAAFRKAAGQRPRGRAADKPMARTPRSRGQVAFSLMFFSAATDSTATNGLYDFVLEAARFADAHDFTALWMPERHFHRFGGPYPDPSVLAGALATVTHRVRLRAGSVVAPLDHPLRIAERWAMVDNLSGGRVDISFGSGWNPNDFVLAPETFTASRNVFRTRIEQVRCLWRGEAVGFRNGRNEEVATAILPRPIQPELPVWISATGTEATFRWAGEHGFNILTMVLGGDLDQLAGKIALYRAARAEAGHDPSAGVVTLMLHTFVHADAAQAETVVRDPFMDYVRSSLDLQRQASDEGRSLSEAQREQIVGFAYERYRRTAALFGTPEECLGLVDRVAAIGVDEIACLIDFGLPNALALEGLEHLDALRRRTAERVTRPPASRTFPALLSQAPHDAGTAMPVAVIGIAARLPASADHWQFWEHLRAGRELIGPPPPDRFPETATSSLGVGGFIDGIEDFEPDRFRIAPTEAALMDPHQRLFLEAVWAALEDAGRRPSDLRGTDAGVFAAVYSTSYADRRARDGQVAIDPLAVTGGIRSMTPNRVSFVFDWTGPSEVVDTACSSSLVAVHRAVRALRSGECGLAIAGGVSLLLSEAENAGLQQLGVLSATGHCRPFDATADGQIRGEGAGVVVLKRLAEAERDGDFVYGVIRGTAINHSGGHAGSLTLPNSHRQADCILAACNDADVPLDSLSYIEAHGAGTAAGDISEISAFANAWRRASLGQARPGWGDGSRCAIGSVKANIGSLDAAGGVTGLIKVLLALRHETLPAMPGLATPASDCSLSGTPLRFQTTTAHWPLPPEASVRRAGVHAYGLGGVNAHLVVEAHPLASTTAACRTEEPCLVLLSAPTAETLAANRQRLLAFLDSPASAATTLSDLAYTLMIGRERFAHRWHAVVSSKNELRRCLALDDDPTPVPSHLAPLLAEVEATHPISREIVDRLQPGRRVPLPPGTFAHRRFPLDGTDTAGEAAEVANTPVAQFYNFVTRPLPESHWELYLTLAPFPAILKDFSWTRTFQDPVSHAAAFDLVLARQREMREVAFAGIDFARIRRVLDFGCGLATDLMVLAERHEHLQSVGYTISAAQAEAARTRVKGRSLDHRIDIYCRDSARDPFPGRFDLAIGFEVAHHIADKSALFGNLATHLVDDGRLVLADCVTSTIMPIELPDLGAYTSTAEDYARILAVAGFAIAECVDLSPEIANFLHDPGLDAMLVAEGAAARHRGAEAGFRLAADVQRSWNGFGSALRAGLLHYVLITAVKDPDQARAEALNRRQLGVA